MKYDIVERGTAVRRDEHLRRFEAATAQAVAAGFLLEVDADEVNALARTGLLPSGWSEAG